MEGQQFAILEIKESCRCCRDNTCVEEMNENKTKRGR